MEVVSVLAVFGIVWWIVLFGVLPIGVRSQLESGSVESGTDPGAPVKHGMGFKMVLTTAIAAVLTGLFVLAVETEIADFGNLPFFRDL